MHGNVREWNQNEYGNPDRTSPGGNNARVLRSGSWFSSSDFARASGRNRFIPGLRFNDIGFRVLYLSHIPRRPQWLALQREVMLFQMLSASEEPFDDEVGKVAGFSLHAGVSA